MVNKKPRVLVVDDSVYFREPMIGLFEKKGFETESAETAAEAYDKIDSKTFDLIICDERIPEGRRIFFA